MLLETKWQVEEEIEWQLLDGKNPAELIISNAKVTDELKRVDGIRNFLKTQN